MKFDISYGWGLLAVALAWSGGIVHELLTTDAPFPDAVEAGMGLGTVYLIVFAFIAPPVGFLCGAAVGTFHAVSDVYHRIRYWVRYGPLPRGKSAVRRRPVGPAQKRSRVVRPLAVLVAVGIERSRVPRKRNRLVRPLAEIREIEAPDHRERRCEDMGLQPRPQRRQRRGDGPTRPPQNHRTPVCRWV